MNFDEEEPDEIYSSEQPSPLLVLKVLLKLAEGQDSLAEKVYETVQLTADLATVVTNAGNDSLRAVENAARGVERAVGNAARGVENAARSSEKTRRLAIKAANDVAKDAPKILKSISSSHNDLVALTTRYIKERLSTNDGSI